MAEITVTPKRSMKNVPNFYDKTKTEARERKRNILYLILNYLTDQRLDAAADALQNEAQLSSQYQTCENVDLDIMLQEYQSYYYTKFQKYPKIIRKLNDSEIIANNNNKLRKKNSAMRQKTAEKEKSSNPSENDDFQFEIISLTSDASRISQEASTRDELSIKDELTQKFQNYPSEWKEMAEQIVKEFIPRNQGTTWKDCIGLNNTIEQLKEVAVYPVLYPALFKNLATWKGVLLHGPPGTGKTLLAKAFASEGFTTFINVTSGTFISKWRGESEKMIQVLFEVAKLVAPTTIFIDEIDALATTSSQIQHEASRRFKSELLVQMDGIATAETDIFILGSTNAPWNLDTSLLRRFEKRILVELPNEDNRRELLKHYIKHPTLIETEELQHLVEKTENFSGSDIKTLGKEVMMAIVREKIKQISNGDNKAEALRNITNSDVEQALERIRPCTTIYDCKRYYEWQDKHGSW